MKLFLFSFFLFPFLAQALEVQASVDKSKLTVNESFVFTIKIQSKDEEPKHLDIPDLSHLEDFYLLGQWSGRESSLRIINGQREQTSVFLKSYRLQPKTIGTLRIEALTLRANKQTFKTKPIFITVSKESKNKIPKSPPQSPPAILPPPFSSPHSLFDVFNNPFLKGNTRQNNIKLRLNLSQYSPYKMEMIKADWLMLQSSGSVHYEPYKQPSLKGFWKEEIGNKKPSSVAGTMIIDQVLYRKALLDSLWLFPLKTGKLTIDSYSIRISHISGFGFHSQREIKSFPIKTITVKNLPSQGLDDTFTGAIGSFEVQTSIKEESAVVNQPLSYKITFKGSGHPRFISLPSIPFPPSVQTYPPVAKSYFSDRGRGTKEFEILIVPQQEGTLNIPSWTLSTFDPGKGQYIFHKIPAFSRSVKKGKPNEESGQTFFEEAQELKKHPLSFEPLNSSYWPQFINQKNLIKFWLTLFCLLLASLLFLYIKTFVFKKKKTLKEKINQKFSAIQELLDKKDWQKAGTQMIQINDFILHTAQIKSFSSGWKEALNNLPPSLNKKYASQFEKLFKSLENLSFSPESHLKEKEALDKAEKLFKDTKTLIHAFLSDL